MSIDTLNTTAPLPSGPCTHLIVLFSGWGNVSSGAALRHDGNGTARLADAMQSVTVPNGVVRVYAVRGALGIPRIVRQTFDWVRAHFDPRGKFIVYGHSAGGFDALQLCQQVSSLGAYYDGTTLQPSATGAVGRTRVDLLLTADAAAGRNDFARGTSRTVAPCVRRHVNWYQSHRDLIGSRGEPHVAADPRATTVVNQPISRFPGIDFPHEQPNANMRTPWANAAQDWAWTGAYQRGLRGGVGDTMLMWRTAHLGGVGHTSIDEWTLHKAELEIRRTLGLAGAGETPSAHVPQR